MHVKAPKLDPIVTKEGKVIIRGGLGIDIDFYSLKHLHTTEVMDILENNTIPDQDAVKEIAEHNSHTSGAMVVKIYDIKNEGRSHKKVKSIMNAF